MTRAQEQTVRGFPLRFTKMSGAGNDFLVFEGVVPKTAELAKTIRALCRRGVGVGADGILFVSFESGDRGQEIVETRYFNADGGAAVFCANGTRCAARYASRRAGAPAEMTIRTGWGDVPATVHLGGSVSILLPEVVFGGTHVPTFDPDELLLERSGVALCVGVPHLVVFVTPRTPLDEIDLPALAPRLRHHPDLQGGANVHLLHQTSPSEFSIRSWERGVEGETLSCGSGAVAAAVVAVIERGIAPPLKFQTKSGEHLVVDLVREGPVARRIVLTGQARIVFEGTLSEEAV